MRLFNYSRVAGTTCGALLANTLRRIVLLGLQTLWTHLHYSMFPLLEDLSTTRVIVGGATAIVGVFAVYLSTNTPSAKAKRVGAVLPPGPKRAFLVGNLFNFPKNKWYESFSSWAEEHGIYHPTCAY